MNTQIQEVTGAVTTANALKMAIKALEQAKEQLEKYWDEDINRGYDIEEMDDSPILLCEDTINACKEALASNSEALEAEQVREDTRDKEFVGLTDDEVHQLHRQHSLYKPTIRKIESMLKEKNI
jgi:hypothetical protein